MNDATTTTAEKINDHLGRLEWMIADAKRDLVKAAEALAHRGMNAVKECEAMMADEPCSLMWVEFAEGELRNAREAKARLNGLIEQQHMLKFLAKNDD